MHNLPDTFLQLRPGQRGLRFVDTHTGGEPTRVLFDVPFDLGEGTLADRAERLSLRYDDWRRAVACEPRGNDVIVGAWVLPASDPDVVAEVVFFNNVGLLGMCGHGTIGVAVAMQQAGLLQCGVHRFATPVGQVEFELQPRGRVRVDNVASYRFRKNVSLHLGDQGTLVGDIAWGGNWFFICEQSPVVVCKQNLAELNRISSLALHELRRQHALCQQGDLNGDQAVVGRDGELIDHVELLWPSDDPAYSDGRNFVLCPGAAYDRSPCGTGTSAKIACLAADNRLQPGEVYRQESIVGSVFEISYQRIDSDSILPTLTGSAFVTAQGQLIVDQDDAFAMGIR